MQTLPDYVIINLEESIEPAVLRTPAQKINFPLTEEDLQDVTIIEKKFDQEPNISGLAANQIGISKQILIFQVPDDPEFKKWRPDIIQTMPKTIWINPSWYPLDEEKSSAYEACFSVPGVAGPVPRYFKIAYQAYLVSGEKLEGIAEGYMARVIQHETDHLQGKLYIDYVKKEDLLPIEEYRAMRVKAMMDNVNNL